MPEPKKSSRSSSSRATSSRARKPAAAGAKRTTAKPAATRTTAKRATAKPAKSDAAVQANLTALRDQLRKGVVLTTDGIKAAMDDAVKRGKLTRKDATELSRHLLASGRTQADSFRSDLEQVIGKGRSQASSDRVLREVDRARRRVGVGSSFPITLYDELNATQVQSRLKDLSKPELRKVRDYERRHGNRKSVLGAIEKKLG
jgi:polyhydroxyalkanoate synthesis regulator phasin